MDPDVKSKSNNCLSDENCVDSTSELNIPEVNHDRKRKFQGKKELTSSDNQSVDENDADEEKKNGIGDENKAVCGEKNEKDFENKSKSTGNKSKRFKGSVNNSVHEKVCVDEEMSAKKGAELTSMSNSHCTKQNENDAEDLGISEGKRNNVFNKQESLNSKAYDAEIDPENQCDSSFAMNAAVHKTEVDTPMETDLTSDVNLAVKEKTLCEDTDKNTFTAVKSNALLEKSLGASPKCSTPELIVSDNGPSDKSEVIKNHSSSSKPEVDKGSSEKNSSLKLAVKDDQEKQDVKGKDSEVNASPAVKADGHRKEGESSKKKKSKTCEECGVKKGLKFQVLYQGKTRFLCSDTCFKNFKTKQKAGKPAAEAPKAETPVQKSVEKCAQCQKDILPGQGYYPNVGDVASLCSEECMKKYHEGNTSPKKCSQCKKNIEDIYNRLTWETMMFCNEDCLGKYQSFLGSHCTCCQSPVQQSSLGKYCVCFGADIRQFCSGSCLEDFKKGLKVCTFCQTDLSAGIDGFLAPVGDKGQFKDFCSQQCMERYEIMNNISKTAPQVQECSHCKKQGSFKIQVKHEDKSYSLCCDNCVAGFRCLFRIKDNMCDTCYKFFVLNPDEEFSLKLEGLHKHFCTKACMTLFVLSHRKIVPCVSCKVKKYNFDMIEKADPNNQIQVFCSLNCLSLYRVSLSATSSKSIRCDNCTKNLPAQYHLTMSDGSIRNFCNYQCVIYFQNQFTNVPALTTTSTTRQTSAAVPASSKATSAAGTPVIANVMSLAPNSSTRSVAPGIVTKLVPQKLVTVRQPVPSIGVMVSKSQIASSTITSPSTSSTAPSIGTSQLREVIVKPPAPKSVKNKAVSCKPIMQTKGISCKPHPCHKAVQTDESPRPIILPIPVPIYVPTPLHMFSRPVPCPVPFPVPIPVPIIIATTKEPSNQVMKHLKDIQETMPPNDYEQELLDIAQIVAEDGSTNQRGNNTPAEIAEKKNEVTVTTDAIQVPIEENEPTAEEIKPITDAPGESQNAIAVSDSESEVEDEYAFKEVKSHHHHHGKRSAGSHGKQRKKSKVNAVQTEEPETSVAATEADNQNSTKQNDLPETHLKVP